MDDSLVTNLEQIRALVAANRVVRFAGQRRPEVYGWVERTQMRHEYAGLPRPDKGVVRLYIAQMTGLSRAQVTRLITGYRRTGRVAAVPYQRIRFSKTCTAADVGTAGLRRSNLLSEGFQGWGVQGSGGRPTGGRTGLQAGLSATSMARRPTTG
jgi:hypothetical protein